MRVLLIVNPFASAVTDRARRRVRETLTALHEVTEVESERRGHAITLAQDAGDGFDALAALGGDGTVNEVATGMAATATSAILVPLPGGSTNVFARTVGVRPTLAKASTQVAEALTRGNVRDLVLSTANGRCILFHVGLGFDAAVVARVERHGALKRRLGQSVFVYDTFATWLRHFDRHEPHFAMRFPDGTTVDDGYYAICLNSDPYTYFGRRPLSLSPGAGERGVTAITVRTVALRPMVGLFVAALRGGDRLQRLPYVDVHADLPSLTVVGRRPFQYQVDGDHLGQATELEIVHGVHRLRLIEVQA